MVASTHDLAEHQSALLGLIAKEDFAGFEGEVTRLISRTDQSDSDQLRDLLLFLERALIEMRVRRAHLNQSVETLQSVRGYLGPRITSPRYLSIIG
jgi:hypothetical protein